MIIEIFRCSYSGKCESNDCPCKGYHVYSKGCNTDCSREACLYATTINVEIGSNGGITCTHAAFVVPEGVEQ